MHIALRWRCRGIEVPNLTSRTLPNAFLASNSSQLSLRPEYLLDFGVALARFASRIR